MTRLHLTELFVVPPRPEICPFPFIEDFIDQAADKVEITCYAGDLPACLYN
jgi:hypothetical protein